MKVQQKIKPVDRPLLGRLVTYVDADGDQYPGEIVGLGEDLARCRGRDPLVTIEYIGLGGLRRRQHQVPPESRALTRRLCWRDRP